MTKQRIGIIGAGVAGMSAAWDLVRAGHDVTIYEAGNEVGGLAAGFRDETWDWTLEKFYHHWFEGDKDMIGLIDELGKKDKMIYPRPKTSYWIDGELVRSEMSPSAFFLPLSFLSTLRMIATGAYVKLTPFWKPLERTTAHQFMRRYMGDEAYNKFFRPLLIGKFGEYYDQVNMAWMWARIVARSLKLGSYVGGFQAFLDDLASAIQQQGAQIHLNTPIEQITTTNGKPSLQANGETQSFDAIISTTSPQAMLKLTEGLADSDYGQRMKKLKSIGGLCVVFALHHSVMPDDTYWLNLPADGTDSDANEFPFLAMVEHTNFLPREHYGGDHIVYCGDYVPVDHKYFSMSDEELIAAFTPSLGKVNPDFSPDWIRKAWVWRAPYAQPVPFVNHSENILPVATPLPGIYWASMSQVYPWDRGTNFAVELGRRVARQVLGTESTT